MKTLIAAALLLALCACAGGSHLAKVRTAADAGEGILTALDTAVAIPAGYAAQKCQPAEDYMECMKPWIKVVDALNAAHALREAMVASLDGVELAEDNPGGMIACFAEAVGHAIAAAQEVGVELSSPAARNWSHFVGTLGTMCVLSTESTLASGSAEGE